MNSYFTILTVAVSRLMCQTGWYSVTHQIHQTTPNILAHKQGYLSFAAKNKTIPTYYYLEISESKFRLTFKGCRMLIYNVFAK